jgi:DNA-binding transcriptional MerR regulator
MKTDYETDEIKKLYYSIGDMAKRFNCAPSKIRFWCDELEIEVPRDRKGNRRFNDKVIVILDQVNYLVEVEGRTLAGTRNVLKNKSTFNLLGHGETCPLCLKPCSSLSGNPSEWPTHLFDKYYHQGCLQSVVSDKVPDLLIQMSERILKFENTLINIHAMCINKESPIAKAAREAVRP